MEEKTVRLNIEIPKELRQELKMYCLKKGINMKVFVKKIILDAIKYKKEEKWNGYKL